MIENNLENQYMEPLCFMYFMDLTRSKPSTSSGSALKPLKERLWASF
jgi:hypothetical protein